MAKNQRQCAYCGNLSDDLTTEHPVPKCLWAGPRPNQTVTVPSCSACKIVFERDEEYFRNVVVVQGDLSNPSVQAHLQPDGPMGRGWSKRPHMLKHVLRGAGVKVRFDHSRTMYVADLGFDLDVPRYHGCIAKVVRGLFFHVRGNALSPTSAITVETDSTKFGSAPYASCIQKMHPWTSFGDRVFACRYALDNNYSDASCWLLCFFETVQVFAMTLPPELRQNQTAPTNT